MTLLFLVLALKLRAVLPRDGQTHAPRPDINCAETSKLSLNRRRMFRPPHI